MRCPFCDHEETNVKDSRPLDEGQAIRRRRECPNCGKRFTTKEKLETRAITAIKADGRKEPFDPAKLVRSMFVALRRRPINRDQIEEIASRIAREIEFGAEVEVTTQQIGQLVLDQLFALDEVGAVRYASVYRDFRSLHDYREFLGDLEQRKNKSSRPVKRVANAG